MYHKRDVFVQVIFWSNKNISFLNLLNYDLLWHEKNIFNHARFKMLAYNIFSNLRYNTTSHAMLYHGMTCDKFLTSGIKQKEYNAED